MRVVDIGSDQNVRESVDARRVYPHQSAFLTRLVRFDLVNGRLVLVFFLDCVLPVSSIALLPVELDTFKQCSANDAVDEIAADFDNVDEDVGGDGNFDVKDEGHARQQHGEKTRFIGRNPFSRPPLPRATPASRAGECSPVAHKSFMLMVGYHQVPLNVPNMTYLTQPVLTDAQPDTHLRLVRVCQPTTAATFFSASHSSVMSSTSDVLTCFHNRLALATNEINSRSFAAAIFQASMCRCVFPDHPNVKNLFSILAEHTKKVGAAYRVC
jgi:hypothetical protein